MLTCNTAQSAAHRQRFSARGAQSGACSERALLVGQGQELAHSKTRPAKFGCRVSHTAFRARETGTFLYYFFFLMCQARKGPSIYIYFFSVAFYVYTRQDILVISCARLYDL